MEVGAASKCGTHTAVNQDACCGIHFADGERAIGLVAVFDGHGALGEFASEAALCALRTAAPTNAAMLDHWMEAPHQAMTELMEVCQRAVIDAHQRDALPPVYEYAVGGAAAVKYTLSETGKEFKVCGASGTRQEPVDFGCTAAIAVVLRESTTSRPRIVYATAGDSVVMVAASDEDGNVGCHMLGEVHNASVEAERRRLKEHETSEGYRSLVVEADGSAYLQAVEGPLRGRCLQPTRGLGHPVFSLYGFSTEPAVSGPHELSGSNLSFLSGYGVEAFAVIVVSDGVSDVIGPETVLEHVVDAGPGEPGAATRAAKVIINEAGALADLSTGGQDRDDASAAVVCW